MTQSRAIRNRVGLEDAESIWEMEKEKRKTRKPLNECAAFIKRYHRDLSGFSLYTEISHKGAMEEKMSQASKFGMNQEAVLPRTNLLDNAKTRQMFNPHIFPLFPLYCPPKNSCNTYSCDA